MMQERNQLLEGLNRALMSKLAATEQQLAMLAAHAEREARAEMRLHREAVYDLKRLGLQCNTLKAQLRTAEAKIARQDQVAEAATALPGISRAQNTPDTRTRVHEGAGTRVQRERQQCTPNALPGETVHEDAGLLVELKQLEHEMARMRADYEAQAGEYEHVIEQQRGLLASTKAESKRLLARIRKAHACELSELGS